MGDKHGMLLKTWLPLPVLFMGEFVAPSLGEMVQFDGLTGGGLLAKGPPPQELLELVLLLDAGGGVPVVNCTGGGVILVISGSWAGVITGIDMRRVLCTLLGLDTGLALLRHLDLYT